jgi:uncharacterized MAPEG superfamily protein
MSADATLTAELRLLTYTAFLSLIVWIPYILAGIQVRGLGRSVRYPSGVTEDLPAWAQRAHRAHMNLVENLAPFAVLVLVADAIGVSNAATVLGAQLFFWARIVQIAVMYAGIPWLRTVSFAVAMIGNLIILAQILYA